jgi:hypothetical protein
MIKCELWNHRSREKSIKVFAIGQQNVAYAHASPIDVLFIIFCT